MSEATHLRATDPLLATAETDAGALGTPAGTAVAFPAGPEPTAFEATTLNEYLVPFVNPEKSHSVASVLVQAAGARAEGDT